LQNAEEKDVTNVQNIGGCGQDPKFESFKVATNI
jgi:hypothetical protein